MLHRDRPPSRTAPGSHTVFPSLSRGDWPPRRQNDYEVAYQFKDKVVRRPPFFLVFCVEREKNNGLSQSTIRARVAHRWGSVDGGAIAKNRVGDFRQRPERFGRTRRLWTAVASALRRCLGRQSLTRSKLPQAASIDGLAHISSRRAKVRTASQPACARRQPSRRIGRVASRSPKPKG